MGLLLSAYKTGCSQYLKVFVWVACHANPRLEEKFIIPGRSYCGPYMIPGRSWQDDTKEICMICVVPEYGQIMIGLVENPGSKQDSLIAYSNNNIYQFLQVFIFPWTDSLHLDVLKQLTGSRR